MFLNCLNRSCVFFFLLENVNVFVWWVIDIVDIFVVKVVVWWVGFVEVFFVVDIVCVVVVDFVEDLGWFGVVVVFFVVDVVCFVVVDCVVKVVGL